MDWRQRGACRNEDPELFFPYDERGKDALSIARATRAKAVCQRCPSLAQCLAWALRQSPLDGGIWGGTTKVERQKILAKSGQTVTD